MRYPITTVLQLCAVLSASVSAAAVSPANKKECEYPKLIDATSDQLQDGLNNGCFTSVDLVNAYTARINEVNSTVHAVTDINPEAISIAEGLDEERKEGKLRGPLHGLPILLKNNIFTLDKLPSTVGSHLLVGSEPPNDATVVTKLRGAGVIILGKAGASQWANFRSTNTTNGWSAYGGQVSAAYHPKQDPSGSSSGSGVSSDLGLAFATLGTETSGSIIGPAKNSNIVGIKATVGLTSRHLVCPISQRQDTIGPMARTVKDAAKVLQVIAGKDSNDNYTSAIPFDEVPNYVEACKPSGLEGKRIGVPRNVLELSEGPGQAPVDEAFKKALSLMAEAGATIVENTNFTAYEEYTSSEVPYAILFADFVSDLADFLPQLTKNPSNVKNLEDVRKATQEHPLEEYPDRNTGVWDSAIDAGLTNKSPEFWPLLQKNLHFGNEGGILGALKRDNLDAVVLPTDLAYAIPGIVGSPVVTVPMGAYPKDTEVQHDARGDLVTAGPGLPIGLSFMGDLWSEEKLIGMAYAYEQKTQTRGTLSRYIEPTSELKDVV